VALASMGLTAAALAVLALGDAGAWTPALLVLAGLAFGPAAGPILALTADIARPAVATLATGVFFAVYYGVFAAGPALTGALRDATGAAETPILAASAMLVLAMPLHALFRALPKPGPG
jgi:predicted MFS family arabinose efflux permease